MMLTQQPITLGSLLVNAGGLQSATPVHGITLDSRKVMTGDVFVALRGERTNGLNFADDALEAGAVAVLADSKQRQGAGKKDVIWIEHLDKKLSHIAGVVYADPSAEMDIIGITGTNGKTTCALLVSQLFTQLGSRAAVMGTLGYGLAGDALEATGFTTPDAIATQAAMRRLVDGGANLLAMEVSSHALVQHRVKDIKIDTAVFTNLTHDHLDFHGDIKHYGKAKARLLKSRGLRHAIVNLDDEWCHSLVKRATELSTCFTYSVANKKADLYCRELEYSCEGVHGVVVCAGQSAAFRSPLVGDFNVSNLLAAMASALVRGFSLERVVERLSELRAAPGRMEQVRIDEHQDIQVVVDYAHTPDALIKALRAVRRHTQGSVWCVFGCGGDRDSRKRSVMGRAAEKSSDYVIVTNDNPRSEDPAQIASQIVGGMHSPERCLVIADRDKAIALAVQQAAAGDAVLIAGKGHERVQIFAHQEVPFSDIDSAKDALIKRRAKS